MDAVVHVLEVALVAHHVPILVKADVLIVVITHVMVIVPMAVKPAV